MTNVAQITTKSSMISGNVITYLLYNNFTKYHNNFYISYNFTEYLFLTYIDITFMNLINYYM